MLKANDNFNEKKTIIFRENNALNLSSILRKIITFLKVFLNFSKKDFYSTVNFLKFRFRVKKN